MYKILNYFLIIFLIIVLVLRSYSDSYSNPLTDKDYNNWINNAYLHLQKQEYINALFCSFKAKRIKPTPEVENLINQIKDEINKLNSKIPLTLIPISDERKVLPNRNQNFVNNPKTKRVKFYRKDYGFFIFPKETFNLVEGEYFDLILEESNINKNNNREIKESISYFIRKNQNVNSDNNQIVEPKAENIETSDVLVDKANEVIKEYMIDIEYENFDDQIVLRRGIKHKKVVALTFDDGPHPVYTPKILKILKDNDVKATFFMIGNKVMEYPKIAYNVFEAGHEIGNHSYTHPFFSKLKTEKIDLEIEKTNDAIKKITGAYEVQFLRPPYGSLPKYVINKAKNESFYIVMWSLDSKDYQGHSPDYMLDKILKNVKNGDVILFHDIHHNTVILISELIPILKKAGFKIVTLKEIYNLNFDKKTKNININTSDKNILNKKLLAKQQIVDNITTNNSKNIGKNKKNKTVKR